MGRIWKPISLALVFVLVSGASTTFAKWGSDRIVTEDRDVKGYNAVSIGISGIVTLVQGDEEGVTIEADEEIMKYIETEVRGQRLLISNRRSSWFHDIKYNGQIRILVKCKQMESVTISGSADVVCKSLNSPELDVTISGSGDARFDSVSADRLDMSVSGSGSVEILEYAGERVFSGVSGSGDLEIMGKAKTLNATVSGSGTVNARNLETDEVSVRISGSGNLYVWANETISGSVSGSGSVFYAGRPTIDLASSGSGSIRHRDR